MAAHPLAALIKRRDRVVSALAPFTTAPVSGAVVPRMAEAVVAVLPPACRYDAVYRSLTTLIGPPPDATVLRRTAHALAGAPKVLAAGRPVLPVQVPTSPSPVILQVVAAEAVSPTDANPKPRIRYRLRIVAGAGCPVDVDVVWAAAFVRFAAVRPDGFGFARPPRGSRPVSGRPFRHPDTLVGMLFRAVIGPDEAGRPKVTAVRCSAGQQAYNRALTEMRHRATFACPFSFTHACHQCPKGQASCPAAVRPLDLIQLTCPRCHRDGLRDPYWGREVCVRCAAATRRPKPDGNHDQARR